jgi:GTP-binding protein EngB required for normal cell division
VVFTKADRVNNSAPARHLAELRKLVPWREDIDVLPTSAKDNAGIIGLRKWASRGLREGSARA